MAEFSLLRLNTAKFTNVHAEYGQLWDNLTTLKLRGRGHGLRGGAKPQHILWSRFVVNVLEVASARLGDIVPAITVENLIKRWADEHLKPGCHPR